MNDGWMSFDCWWHIESVKARAFAIVAYKVVGGHDAYDGRLFTQVHIHCIAYLGDSGVRSPDVAMVKVTDCLLIHDSGGPCCLAGKVRARPHMHRPAWRHWILNVCRYTYDETELSWARTLLLINKVSTVVNMFGRHRLIGIVTTSYPLAVCDLALCRVFVLLQKLIDLLKASQVTTIQHQSTCKLPDVAIPNMFIICYRK